MQQVAVEAIGAQPRQRALAGLIVPARDALLGSTFETRKTSSRRPAIASPTSFFRVAVHLGRVDMGHAEVEPALSAATAPALPLPPISQVPCPMTETFAS